MGSQVNYLSLSEYVHRLAEDVGLPHNIETFYGREKELIAIIKGCPFLYDQSHKAFKDLANREATWLAIANLFNSDKEEVKSRWKSLRDHYSRNRGSSNKNFIEDLSFLDCHIRPRHRRDYSYRASVNEVTPDQTDCLESDSQQDESINYEGNKSYYHAFEDDTAVINFIKMVESRPILYTRCHSHSRNEESIAAAWKEISEETGASVDGCRAYWKTLREQFGRSRRYKSLNKKKPFRFFSHLLFLHQHVGRRRRFAKSQRPSEYYVSNSDSCETKDKDFSTKIEFVCESPNQDRVDTQDSNFFLNSSDYEMTEERLPDGYLGNKEQDSLSTNDFYTEDDKFAQSIAAELRKISSAKKKLKLKADIYRLLYESVDD